MEIGAGRGYWGSLIQNAGSKYAGYDIVLAAKDSEFPPWTNIKKGGPNALKKHSDHTLLLCYPDDFEHSDESMALKCLETYRGDTIIHIGETLGQTLLENPWGKSSATDFQEMLNAQFHKVLQVPLPSWQGSVDTLSVWKRTEVCAIDDITFKSIPAGERLDLVQCSPDYKHLV